jgi:hypothetical protein
VPIETIEVFWLLPRGTPKLAATDHRSIARRYKAVVLKYRYPLHEGRSERVHREGARQAVAVSVAETGRKPNQAHRLVNNTSEMSPSESL